MSLIRKHGAVLQAWACLALVKLSGCNFSTDRRTFPTEEIMCALNFNFAPKVP